MGAGERANTNRSKAHAPERRRAPHLHGTSHSDVDHAAGAIAVSLTLIIIVVACGRHRSVAWNVPVNASNSFRSIFLCVRKNG